MINKIDILHERHCGDFTCHAGEKSAGLFCVVSYHHEIIVKLGEYGFDSFPESLICARWWSPVPLIQPIRYFKRDIGNFEKIFLNFRTEISLVSKHHAIVIFPLHIFEIMDIVYTCSGQVIRVDNATYSTDSVKFISIIVETLRGTVSPIRSSIDIIAPHYTTLRPCVLTYLYGLGINAEHVFFSINGNRYILADFLSKPRRQLTTHIELSTTYQIWQIILAFIMQAMKKEVFAVKSEGLSGYGKSHDFEIGKLRDNATTWYVSEFIYTIFGEIFADSKDSYEICYEVAHKQSNSS